MLRLKTASLFTLILLVAAIGCGPRQDQPIEGTAAPSSEESAEPAASEPAAAGPTAAATLQGREGTNISGEITFTSTAGGVEIVAHVIGVEGSGLHGFHLHETGDCSAPDFSSAGGHFNPTGAPHGGPMDAEHHAGDLGNIEISPDGSAHLEIFSSMLTVEPGPSSVVGRGVILHEGEDDLVSQPTGDAGGRLACGVVQLAEEAAEGDDEPGIGDTGDGRGPV